MPTPSRQSKYEAVAAHRLSGVILVLENIHDPHNAAAIMRSAESLGIQHLWLICETVEVWDPKVIGKKSATFANKWLDFEIFKTSKEAIKQLKEADFTLFGTMLDENATPLQSADFTKASNIALIMGNEKSGLSRAMQKALDHKIYIPMYGFTQSFNVSVACAICLWELSHQRQSKNMILDQVAQTRLIEQFKETQKLNAK
ncbi:MAG TPA: RNA methyltransferase [Candidatus Gracilibacteria bacterium]